MSTSALRAQVLSLNKEEVPREWAGGFICAPGLPLAMWVAELARRVNNLDRYRDLLAKKPAKVVYWLGGMFAPESFVTATRQFAAQVRPSTGVNGFLAVYQ